MKKILALFLSLCLVGGCLSGCAAMGEIAGNMANAAAKELENQLKSALEKNKVEVLELKTAFGKLNDEGGSLQFFCAALVKTGNTESLEKVADAIGGLFYTHGWEDISASTLENKHLVHKNITFKHSDFSEGNYYVIYGYSPSLTGGN